MTTVSQSRPATTDRPGRRHWVPFVVINALIIFFGTTYAFFPMGTVEADGNQTTGLLHVPREVWGAYLIASGLAMLLVAVTAFRAGRPWARYALGYEFLFLLAVAVIEPDPVVPTLFALVLGFALWRSTRGDDAVG
jgi:hypothetical protein